MGFACDGFSTLNNFPIALEDKGEPGDTFDGIKAYLETYHPKIVIFENAMNALWMTEKVTNWRGNIDVKNIRVHMKRADFSIKIDTKLHYLLHTRNPFDCLAKIDCASSTSGL